MNQRIYVTDVSQRIFDDLRPIEARVVNNSDEAEAEVDGSSCHEDKRPDAAVDGDVEERVDARQGTLHISLREYFRIRCVQSRQIRYVKRRQTEGCKPGVVA